jgi:membrane protease YdiL (CAAX protease family)
MAVLAVFVIAILAFFSPGLQRAARAFFANTPRGVWAVPPVLTAVFCGVAAYKGAFSLQLTILVLLYTAAPTACAYFAGPRASRPVSLDFLAIVFLWLPLEFAAGAQLIPKGVQGYLHSVAYGVAILLGLILFLCFRAFEGMKYNVPRSARDGWITLAGFLLTAPILIVLGVWIGFMPAFHQSTVPAARMALAFPIVLLGTALPEEILFRSLIQNLLFQRLGRTTGVLIIASVIFGAAHLDNGPQPPPNWRYFILATIAGFGYGRVFDRSTTILSSVVFHTLVDWIKHYYF